MRRRQLFEFSDQRWLPRPFRAYLLELLQYQLTSGKIYAPAVPTLERALVRSRCDRIVDLGSGGGATVLQIQRLLAERGLWISVVMTDRFPSDAVATRSDASYCAEPVDAASVPSHLTGLRTLFTTFHHFAPDTAQAVLRGAVAAGEPIAVFEFTERRLSNLVGMALSPIAVLALTRRARTRRLGRFFWTYVVPVVPFLYWWDGMVSHWRTYSESELLAMVAALGETPFHWEAGRIACDGYAITYLVGLPGRSDPESRS